MVERITLEDLCTPEELGREEIEPGEEILLEATIESAEFFSDRPDKMVVTTEALFNNKDDKEAPDTTKCRITWLGLGFEAKFSDGEKVAADADGIWKSKHMQSKLKEFDDYYIGKLGYRSFTNQDKSKLKLDASQVLRKIFNFSLMNKVEFKEINGHGIYGLFNWGLGKLADKIRGSNNGEEGIDKNVIAFVVSGLLTAGFALLSHATGGAVNLQQNGLLGRASNNSILSSPYCIAYVKPGVDGSPDKVFVRRILVIGFWTSSISKWQRRHGSGGKDVGTLSK